MVLIDVVVLMVAGQVREMVVGIVLLKNGAISPPLSDGMDAGVTSGRSDGQKRSQGRKSRFGGPGWGNGRAATS